MNVSLSRQSFHFRHFSFRAMGLFLIATVFLSLFATSAFGQPSGRGASANSTPSFVPGELLIQFKETASDAELTDAVRQAGLGIKRTIQTAAMREGGHPGLNIAATKMPIEQALRLLNRHPGVAFAEPNWIVNHQATANESYYTSGNLWGMYGDRTSPGNRFGSQAAEAWAANYTGSKDVYVGVIDQGIQIGHPDLAANIWVNPFDRIDGVDNDGNGYVDDLNGWNFLDGNNSLYNGTGESHGTHVAGTIGAIGGNGQGVAGVNWNVTLIGAKFIGVNGGTVENAIKAVDYFTNLKRRKGLNIVAVNCSWGGAGYSQGLHDAMLRAAKAGILIIAAAGNGDANGNGINNDSSPDYPSCFDTSRGTSTESAASYDAVVSVAALDSSGNKPQWANFGASTVDLAAPGTSILSTIPNSTYAYATGSSMATPHVTGAAALYASTHPNASAAQIKSALLSAVASTSSLSGITKTGGRLDLSSVIVPETSTEPAPTLAPPTGVTATVGSTRITIQWNGSTGASSYRIKRSKTNGGPYSTIASTTRTSHTDTGLVNGRTYYYVVSAVYSSGESANSSQVSGTPGTTTTTPSPAAPAAPSNLSATAASSSQINLKWSDNSADESGFKIERKTGSGGSYSHIGSVGTGVTTFSNNALSAGTQYYFRVRASNSAGDSAYSNEATATTHSGAVSSSAPSNLTATAGNTTITLQWTGVSGATSYNVKRSKTNGGPHNTIARVTSPTYRDTGLVNGRTYYYVISANTSAGESANSNQAHGTPAP